MELRIGFDAYMTEKIFWKKSKSKTSTKDKIK
jgi:hypothetical protein